MEIINVKVNELKEYENNPRNNEKAVGIVEQSIKEYGFKNPIIIDKNNVIVAGHTRLIAAKNLGYKEVPCIKADDLTEEQVKAFRLVDNKTSEFAEWDIEKLEEELASIEIDLVDFGFEKFDPDDFDTDFTLPSEDKSPIQTMTFTLHENQLATIEAAIDFVKDDVKETFGNENKKGNALYEVVRQWEEQKRL